MSEEINYLPPMEDSQPDKVEEQSIQPEIAQPEEKTYPIVIRCGADDKVYVLEKRWIKNPETLNKLGFDFPNVIEVPKEIFDKYHTGESIDLKDYSEPQPAQEEPQPNFEEPSKVSDDKQYKPPLY